jgi:hypothetical protein
LFIDILPGEELFYEIYIASPQINSANGAAIDSHRVLHHDFYAWWCLTQVSERHLPSCPENLENFGWRAFATRQFLA